MKPLTLMPRAAVVVLAATLIVIPVASDDLALQNLVILSLVLAVGAVSINIMAGYAGYYSLGEAVPFGLGAYAVALLSLHVGASPFVWVPVGGLVAAAFALFTGAIAARGRGHAFVILSLAVLLLVQFVALNWESLTGGPAGLTLPLPQWDVAYQNWPFYYGLLALLALALCVSARIRRVKLGMGLLAIREDEDKAATIGITTPIHKLLGFVTGAALLGMAGGIYAYYTSFVEPRGIFSILFGAQLLLAMLLGGAGTLFGPVLGAFIIQALNDYGNQWFGGGNARLFIVGGLLIAVVLLLPHGLLPSISRWIEARRARGTAARVGQRLEVGGEPPPSIAPMGSSPPPQLALVPSLQVVDLRKAFGGVKAVDGCSFRVERGSITGLIGPNGSGKTTTFNLIGGSMRPDAGEVWLDGERIDGLPSWARAHRGLARTFQTTRLFRQLTVVENVVAPQRAFSWRKLDANAASGAEAARARELLEFVGMGRYGDHLAGSLSYGQQKLVELAQVLMLDPSVILLDEPASGINPRMIERLALLLRELNDHGTTLLVVEHNMPFVLELSDTVLVLAQGSCICEGDPQAIQRDPQVINAYLGDDLAIAQGAGA